MNRFLASVTVDGVPRLASEPPAFTARGCQILYRGYVANRPALAAEARRRGHPVESGSDAIVFALAYEWWGADLPRHVLGEYAVAVYHSAERTLLLTHDELGLVPLFYSEAPGAIRFGSRLDDLVIETGIGELDEEYIADFLAQGEHFGDRTPYRHIHRVRPGRSLVWKDGCLTSHETWTLTDVQPLRYPDDRDYEEHLRQLVTEAVTSAMPVTGKVWCELSGGLDSSTVLSVAALSRLEAVEAVSFVYPKSHTADEREWMHLVLEKYLVPWHPIDADAVSPFSEMPDGFGGEPDVSLLVAGHDRVYDALLATHDVDIVLTGMGGDAVLLGDGPEPYYLADLLRQGRIGELWTRLRSWATGSPAKRSLTHWLIRCAVRPTLRHRRGDLIEYHSVVIPWASPQFSERTQLAQRGRSSYVPRLASVGDSWFFEGVLRCANVVAMRFHQRQICAEFRHPLLYRPLIEYMCAVPWTTKLQPDGDRALQRRAFEGILPAGTIQRRSKRGSDQAFYAGLESSTEWYTRLTQQPCIVDRGYVEADRWRQAVRQARLGRTIGIKYFSASAMLEIWLQQLECLGKSRRFASLHTRSKASSSANDG